jgi:hypothetical protein
VQIELEQAGCAVCRPRRAKAPPCAGHAAAVQIEADLEGEQRGEGDGRDGGAAGGSIVKREGGWDRERGGRGGEGREDACAGHGRHLRCAQAPLRQQGQGTARGRMEDG